MSLFNSQTIFNILITLIICSAMFIFFRFKLRVLEISQKEQAKVLQSLVMNMRSGGQPRNIVSDEEIMKHMQMQMQIQQNGAGAGAGASEVNQHNRSNDLIDVSDEEDDDDDNDEDDDTDSESESSSDSRDDSDSSSEDDNDENHDNTTKKIIFSNNGVLESQMVEHLTGDDIKVIELTEPLYPMCSGSKHDTSDVSDDDGDDDDDDDGEDASDDDTSDGNDIDDNNDETSDNTEVKIEELPSHASLSLQQEQHLDVSTIDATEIKTIFKVDKQQQQNQHTDYNSMNVQALKQHLKTKLSAEGMQYNETAINKLNKKELIKHLTQG